MQGNAKFVKTLIEKYFFSDEFKSICGKVNRIPNFTEPFKIGLMQQVMNYVVTHCLIIKDDKNLDSTLNGILDNFDYSEIKYDFEIENYFEKIRCETLKKQLLEKLNMETIDQTSSQEVFDYLFENRYKFHGTNSLFSESINESGLSIDRRLYDQEEVFDIMRIFKKYNSHDYGGLEYLDFSDKHISLADNYLTTIRYSNTSPEWFNGFCGNETFAHRQYEEAQQNVINRVQHMNPDDQQKVINFFDKHWEVFASADPVFIMIDINGLSDEDRSSYIKSHNRHFSEWDFDEFFEWANYRKTSVNEYYKEDIPKEYLTTVKTPSYVDIKNHMNNGNSYDSNNSGDKRFK